MASLKDGLWLSSLPKVSLRMKHVLLDAFETPEKIYFSESGEYSLVEGITRPVIAALEEGRSLDGADRILGDCERLGLRVLTIQDTEYPDRLRNICDPPLLLYVQGRMPLFDDEVTVAMVGEFFKQLLTYGLTYTTALYLVPPALRGLVVGLGAALALRRGCGTGRNPFIHTALNTGAYLQRAVWLFPIALRCGISTAACQKHCRRHCNCSCSRHKFFHHNPLLFLSLYLDSGVYERVENIH